MITQLCQTYLNLTSTEMRQLSECTCVHTVLCTFCTADRFSVLCTLVRRICESGFMLKLDFVYCAVHMYLTVFVWPLLWWPKTSFCTLLYTGGRSAPVFPPLSLSDTPALCLRPSQRGLTGQRGG